MKTGARRIERKKEREVPLAARLIAADRDVLTALYVTAKGDLAVPVDLGRHELASQTGLPLRTVDRALLRLRKRNLIAVRRRKRETAQIYLLAGAVPYCQSTVVVRAGVPSAPTAAGRVPPGFKGDPKAFNLTLILRKPDRYGPVDIAQFYVENATADEQYRIERLGESGSLPADITGYGPLDEALRFWFDQRMKKERVRRSMLSIFRPTSGASLDGSEELA